MNYNKKSIFLQLRKTLLSSAYMQVVGKAMTTELSPQLIEMNKLLTSL